MADLGAVGELVGFWYPMPWDWVPLHLRPGGLPPRGVMMPELEVARLYEPAQYRTISGQVVHEGIPSVAVTVWGWSGRELRGKTATAADGSWSLEIGPGQYGITYHVTGYRPITHGPYAF